MDAVKGIFPRKLLPAALFKYFCSFCLMTFAFMQAAQFGIIILIHGNESFLKEKQPESFRRERGEQNRILKRKTGYWLDETGH